MVYTNDGYIMLLDAIQFNGVQIGNIAEDGIDWGGDAAEYLKLYAAQVRTGPVKKLLKKGATNVLKFNLIELLPRNCQTVMGGEVAGDAWKAPGDSVNLEGPAKIVCGTGQTIDIAKASLNGAVRGKLGGDEALHIECELEVLQPSDGSSPFTIAPTQPSLTASPTSLSFVKGGETKTLTVSASGPFSVGQAPSGFSVEVSGGQIRVTAAANGGSTQRTGNLVFTLKGDTSKTATVSLTQAG